MTERQRIVITDIHGHADKLEDVVKTFGNEAEYVFGGDFIDRGPSSRVVLDIIKGLTHKTVLLGNHEYIATASLLDGRQHERDDVWAKGWLNPDHRVRTESNFLQNYGHEGMHPYHFGERRRLKATLAALGHLDILDWADSYYDREDLVVVHAGLKPYVPWREQRIDLDISDTLRHDHLFQQIPVQLNDHVLARTVRLPEDLSDGQTLVTGHMHMSDVSAEDRMVVAKSGSRRVMLASRLIMGDPLYVYDDDDKIVREFK